MRTKIVATTAVFLIAAGIIFFLKQAENIAVLRTEKQEAEKTIEELERKLCKNGYYELFYGEWKATERIHIEPMPIRGIEYSEEEIDAFVSTMIANGIMEKTIQFTEEKTVIDGTEIIEKICYEYTVFLADDNFNLGFMTKLKDIGLTETDNNYFVFVEARSKEDPHLKSCEFFVKNKNTIIVRHGADYVEYDRVSYEGGSENPVIFSG